MKLFFPRHALQSRCIATAVFLFISMVNLQAQCLSFTKIVTGSTSTHSLGIKTDGTLWGWGNNLYGQLGSDTSGNISEEPQQAGTAANWAAIATGVNHSLGITADGRLWAWGRGDECQLGDGNGFGNPHSVTMPEEIVVAGKTWKAIAACENHSFAISTDGRLWSWGYYGFINTSGNPEAVPTLVGSDTDWIAVSTGQLHTIVLKKDSTLWCWGRNGEGEAGDSTTSDNTYLPVEIDSNHVWVSISAGYDHSCAIKSDGTLWTWGDNTYGQLGNGTKVNGTKGPKQVGNDTWIATAAGFDHALAIAADGSVWGWGLNTGGQLGQETTTVFDTTLPVLIDNFYRWKAVYGGADYSLAQTTDGSGWGWGGNEDAELGDGTHLRRYQPVQTGTPAVYAALAGTGSSQTLYQRLQEDYAVNCYSLIASIAQSSDNDSIFGATTSSVWIDGEVRTDNVGKPYVQRHYEIRLPGRSGAPVGTGNITLYFTPAEFAAYNASPGVLNGTYPKLPVDSADVDGYRGNLRINWYNSVSFDGSGDQTKYSGTPVLLTPGSVLYANGRWQATVTTKVFGGFFGVTGATVLPLTWLHVAASPDAEGKVKIDWQVQEQDVANYRVERSFDGRQFTLLATVAGEGNGVHSYTATDAQRLTGTTFYRIRQTGINGSVAYSTVMKVSALPAQPVVFLYPNPVRDVLYVSGLAKNVIYHTAVTDLSGRVLITKDLNSLTNHLVASGLVKGVYVLQLTAPSSITTVKFVKE